MGKEKYLKSNGWNFSRSDGNYQSTSLCASSIASLQYSLCKVSRESVLKYKSEYVASCLKPLERSPIPIRIKFKLQILQDSPPLSPASWGTAHPDCTMSQPWLSFSDNALNSVLTLGPYTCQSLLLWIFFPCFQHPSSYITPNPWDLTLHDTPLERTFHHPGRLDYLSAIPLPTSTPPNLSPSFRSKMKITLEIQFSTVL